MNIDQIMSRNAKTCRPTDTLYEAARLMWDHDIGAVPVVNDEGVPIAMLTDRDICMACYTQGLPPGQIAVSTAMSQKLITCFEDEPIAAAESLMRTQQIRRLPVVSRKKKLVGVLSLNDIAMHSHTKRSGVHRDELGPDAIARTLSAICARPAAMAMAEE